MTNHTYSPSTVPSIDGHGCLHRERLSDGTYSLRRCTLPERLHGKAIVAQVTAPFDPCFLCGEEDCDSHRNMPPGNYHSSSFR